MSEKFRQEINHLRNRSRNIAISINVVGVIVIFMLINTVEPLTNHDAIIVIPTILGAMFLIIFSSTNNFFSRWLTNPNSGKSTQENEK